MESFSNTDQFAKIIKKIDLRFYVTNDCLCLLVFVRSRSEFKTKYEKVEEFDIRNLLCFCLFKGIFYFLPW